MSLASVYIQGLWYFLSFCSLGWYYPSPPGTTQSNMFHSPQNYFAWVHTVLVILSSELDGYQLSWNCLEALHCDWTAMMYSREVHSGFHPTFTPPFLDTNFTLIVNNHGWVWAWIYLTSLTNLTLVYDGLEVWAEWLELLATSRSIWPTGLSAACSK